MKVRSDFIDSVPEQAQILKLFDRAEFLAASWFRSQKIANIKFRFGMKHFGLFLIELDSELKYWLFVGDCPPALYNCCNESESGLLQLYCNDIVAWLIGNNFSPAMINQSICEANSWNEIGRSSDTVSMLRSRCEFLQRNAKSIESYD